VRWERTDNDAVGWVRARTLSGTAATAAEDVAIAAAKRDYADNQRTVSGSYTKPFPSIHLNHDITANLKARLSWSTSFARPGFRRSRPVKRRTRPTRPTTANLR
jgi:hypothetical protein